MWQRNSHPGNVYEPIKVSAPRHKKIMLAVSERLVVFRIMINVAGATTKDHPRMKTVPGMKLAQLLGLISMAR